MALENRKQNTIMLTQGLVMKLENVIRDNPKLDRRRFYIAVDLILRNSRKQDNSFAYLRMKLLKDKSYLGKYAKSYLDALQDHDIIFRSPDYLVGERSKKHLFTPEAFDGFNGIEFFTQQEVEVTPHYYEKLRKARARPEKEHLAVQWDLMKSNDFKIDIAGATRWVVEYLKEIEGEDKANKILSYSMMIRDLHMKHIFVAEDEKTGRVFTNFSSMKKELRQFCSYKGYHFHSVDLKSAQPYLLGAELMDNRHYKNKDNVKRYFETVTQDDIYNYFMDQFDGTIERDDAKVEFLKAINSKNKHRQAFKPILKEHFPSVYSYVLKTNKEANNTLSLRLMKKESDLFIPVVNECCKLGCLSVHDSLFFINKDDVRYKVTTALNNRFKELGYVGYHLKEECTKKLCKL